VYYLIEKMLQNVNMAG